MPVRLGIVAAAAAVLLALLPLSEARAQLPGFAVGGGEGSFVGETGGGVIRELRVEGTQRVDAETVRSYMASQIGDPFEPELLDRSLKQLFGTGYFSDVQLVRDGDALVVRVQENPVINRVAFEGNFKVRNDALSSEVQLRPRSVFTRSRVQSDVRRLLDLYQRRGYFAATIEPKIIELPQNRVDLVFEINEGESTMVERIVFVGNRRFSDGQLRGEIRTVERRWYRFFTSDDVYDPDRISVDRELLRRFYLKEGYADFRVMSAVAELTPERSGFIVTFAVEEGDRYRFGGVDVVSQIPDIPAERLAPIVERRIDAGDWYNADLIERIVQEMTDEVGQFGFAFVDIRPRLRRDRDAGTIDVTFEVGEGPRVFVNRIEIEGNVRTLDRVIRREIRLMEGDAFNTARLRDSERRINNLDFFSRVEIESEPTDDPDRTDIRVRVQEQSTGELSLGAGFSTQAGLLTDVGLRERNLLGRGQDARIGAFISQRSQMFDFSFTEPYFLDRNLAAGFDVFRRRNDFRDDSSYDFKSTGGALRAGYRIGENIRQRWSYTLSRDEVISAPNASAFIRQEDGRQTTSAIGHQLTFDYTDTIIDPSDGTLVTIRNDLAGLGGTRRHMRNEITATQYIPLMDQWVFSLTGRAGHIFGLGQDVGLYERFQMGGERLRGFEVAGIGPRDAATRDALGGNYFYGGTAELRFPLPVPDELGVSGRMFSDVGTLAGLDYSNQAGILDERSLRASAGVGLSWRSPFGPVRIDLAHAFMKESFDKTEVLFFSFGTRF